MKSIFDMLTQLMRGCGKVAMRGFEELCGQELIEKLEYSTNQKVRMCATEFFQEFYGGSTEADELFQQYYHQAEHIPQPKTDAERYFDDDDIEGQYYQECDIQENE